MCQGCTTYLDHIVDTQLKNPYFKDIPSLYDFPEVFPENLPRLPSEREVKFPIEHSVGSTPISIIPYWMDPAD